MSHVHAFSCIHTFLFLLFDIKIAWYFSNCLSLSLPLSVFLMLVSSWHLNVSLLRPKTVFVLGLLLLLLHLTPLPLMSSSMMKRPNRTSWRTFRDTAFIRNAKSFCQTFYTLTYPLLSTVGVGNHFLLS